ncbi:MAG TPA: histidine kinase [Flavisolibacter sp.]|nr:histidine kinase [Flavisolibacter sp.]
MSSLIQTARFRTAFGICWCCWTLLHFVVLNKAGFSWQIALSDSLICNLLLAATASLVSLTLQYYLPDQNKYGYLSALCIVLSVVWLSVSRAVLLMLLDEGAEYESFFSQSLLIRGATGFLIISCVALISVLWYTLQDRQQTEKRRAEADKLAKDAELNNLRQQLQPHFLFNSLNSINALVGTQPQKARTMIQQLSDFLRGTLKKEQKEWISLDEELQHLQLYLEIEKVRFGHRLSAVINNNTENARLPVMLLQPIVENAIKFGLYDTTEDITITIEAETKVDHLLLQVKNPFDAETSLPGKGTGFGLSSVQRRLYLLFARNDLLQTETQENLFITTIKIPQS